jgi:Ca2+-binding EF-hand superfamily protein
LEAARDVVASIHQYAEQEREDAQSLADQVSDFCVQDLQMDDLVAAHTPMANVPQFDRELPKTPAEDDLLADLRARRTRAMTERAAFTAVDQAERLQHQAAELEERMAAAESKASQAAANSQAAAVQAAKAAQRSTQAADRAVSVSPPDLNSNLTPSVPAPTSIKELHSTMSPGSGTHVPAPVELFGTLRAHSPPSAQPGQFGHGQMDGRHSMERRASPGPDLRGEISAQVQLELDEQRRQHEQQMRIHQEQLERMQQDSGSTEAPHTRTATNHSRGENEPRSADGNLAATASSVTDVLFDRLDTNGDGVITRAEFTTGLQRASRQSNQSPYNSPPLRSSEVNGMQEVDAERQRLRDEIAAAADAAETSLAMHQTTVTASPHVHAHDREQRPRGHQMHAHMSTRDATTQPSLPIHDSWLSDGAQPWVDHSATYAETQTRPHSTAAADPVAAALLRVCWEAIHYRKRMLWGRPIDSLKSFYNAVESQPSIASTRLGPQLRDIREGLRHLDIGLTEAQLDRLIATMHLDDQQAAVSFDSFSRWLHMPRSDAGIIEAANVANLPGAGRTPAAHALSLLSEANVRPSTAQLDAIAQIQLQARGSRDDVHPRSAESKQRRPRGAAAAQIAADRLRSRSPTARSKSDGSGGPTRRGNTMQRSGNRAGRAQNRPVQHTLPGHAAPSTSLGQHGVEPTNLPGAWTRLQSDDHEPKKLTAAVQQELQRVLWHAVHYKKRTLYGHKINSLAQFFRAIDKDRSGEISSSELREACARLDIGLTPLQLDRCDATMPRKCTNQPLCIYQR